MADKNTETKVVQVRFDNSKFSKNIQKAQKQLKEFDKNLQFKNGAKSIKEVQKALDEVETKNLNKELEKTDSIIHKITVSIKDLVKLKLLSKAMDVVINKSASLIKNMVGINNVIAGWQQYETQMINVGGILNQVESKGKTIEDVVEAMDRLRWYTDETSYSFTTLSNGIRQFVIAGIDLNQAAEAAMGVTNLAGSAKVFDEYKIQSAMDAVSKSMQTGYMDVMKWTSLTNTAGVVTEEFTNMLLEEAAAQGKLVKSAAGQYKTKKGGKLVTPENIRSTLSDKWLNSNVLTNVMNRYASASSTVETFSGLMAEQTAESLAEINELFKDSGIQFQSFEEILSKLPEDVEDSTSLTARQTGKFLEELGYKFDEVSYKAFKSAQETTSLSQAITYVEKAISTQWSNIFEKIFGGYDRATELWSDVSDKFYDIFITPFESLSDIFDKWSNRAEGGAEDFRKVLLTIIDVVGKFKESVAEGFKAAFGEFGPDTLVKITNSLKTFFETLKNNISLFKGITAIVKIIASVLRVTSKINGALLKIAFKLLIALEPLFDLVADILDKIADGIIWIIDMVDELGILDTIIEAITVVIDGLAKGLKKVIDWIKGKIDLQKVLEGVRTALDRIKDALKWIIDHLNEAIEALKEWYEESEFAQAVTEAYATAVEKVKNAFSGFGKASEEATKGIENVNDAGEEATEKTSWMDRIKKTFVSIGEFLKTIWSKIVEFLDESGVLKVLQTIIKPIFDFFAGLFKQFKQLAQEDPMKALSLIFKVVLGIIGIIALLNIINIVRGASWCMDEIWATLRNFRKKISAERWKALASAVLIISASVLILTFAIENLAKLDVSAKRAWMAVGIIAVLLAAYAGILTLMSFMKTNIRAGMAASGIIISTAIALAVFIRAVSKVLKETKDYSTTDVWRAMAVIGVIIGLWCFTIFATFRRKETEWLIKKSSTVVGPGLISLAKTLIAVWLFAKIAFMIADKVKEYDDTTLKNAGIVFGTIIGSLIVIYYAFNKIGAISSKINPVSLGVKLVSDFTSIVFAILAAIAIFYVVKYISWGDILGGMGKVLAIFAYISVIVVALNGLARLINWINPGALKIKMAKGLGSIAWSAFLCVAALKLASGLSIGEILAGGAIIIGLYGAIGGIAVALNATSKVVEMTINKTGIAKKGAKSPIGSAILAISISVFLMLGAIKLANRIDPEEFAEGFGRITAILVLLTVFMSVLTRASKAVDGKSIAFAVGSLAVSVGLILLLAWILTLKNENNEYIFKPKDLNHAGQVFGMVAVLILAYMAVLGVINKWLPSTIKSAASVAILMGVLIASVFAILASIAWLEELSKNEKFDESLAAIKWIFFAVSIFITAVMVSLAILKKELDIKTVLTISVLIGVLVGAIVGIVGAIAILSSISDYIKVWQSLIVIGFIIAALALIVYGFVKLAENIHKHADMRKDVITISMLVGVLVGAILGIVGAIAILSSISDSTRVGQSLIVIGLITAALALIVYGFVKLAENIHKHADMRKDVITISILVGVLVGAILGIVGAIAIIGEINEVKLQQGERVVGEIAAGFIIFILAFSLMMKIVKDDPNFGKNAIKLMIMVGVLVAAIYGIIGAMALVGEMGKDKAILGGLVVLAISGLLLLMLLAIIGLAKMASRLDVSKTMLLSLAGSILLFVIAIVAIAFAMTMLADIPEDRIWPTFGVIAAISGVLIGMMALIVVIAKMKTSIGSMAVGALAIVAAAASLRIIADAFTELSDINYKQLWAITGVFAALIGVLTAFLALVAVIALIPGGIAAEGLGGLLLLAFAAFLRLTADAADVASKSFDRFANTLKDLMKSFTEDEISRMYKLSKAILALTGANIVSSIGQFAGSVVNLVTSVVNLAESGVKALQSVFDWVSSKFKKTEISNLERQAEAYKTLAESTKTLDDIDLNSIKDRIENFNDYVRNIDITFIDSYVDAIEKLEYTLTDSGAVNSLTAGMTLFTLAASMSGAISSVSPANLQALGDAYNSFRLLLEEIRENPVIKPTIDLTDFNAGMDEIRRQFGEYGLSVSTKAKTVENESSGHWGTYALKNLSKLLPWNWGSDKDDEKVVVYNTYNLNDAMMYSYDAQRGFENSMEQAFRKKGWKGH